MIKTLSLQIQNPILDLYKMIERSIVLIPKLIDCFDGKVQIFDFEKQQQEDSFHQMQ